MLIPNGFALAKYEWTLLNDPEPMIFTMGHDISLAVTPQVAANGLFAHLLTAIPAANWGSNYTFRQVELVVGTTAGGQGPYSTFFSTNTAVAGTSTAERPPQNVASLVTKETAAPGRRGRGRMYLPGFLPNTNILPGGIIDATVRTNREGLLQAWFAKLQVEDLPPFLLHSTAPATPTEITGFTLESLVATQRRRLRH